MHRRPNGRSRGRARACILSLLVAPGLAWLDLQAQPFDGSELTLGPQVSSGDLAGAIFSMPAAGDFDGDGVLDLVVATIHQGEGVRFFRGIQGAHAGTSGGGASGGARKIEAPRFEPGVDLDLPAVPMTGLDWNADGIADLLLLDSGGAGGAGRRGLSLLLAKGGNPPVFEKARALFGLDSPRAISEAKFLTARVVDRFVDVIVGGMNFDGHWPEGRDHRTADIGSWRGYDATGRWRGREGLGYLVRFRLARGNPRIDGPASLVQSGTLLVGEFNPLAGHLAASPVAIDVDGDRDGDIVYADFVGNFFLARNVGTDVAPVYLDPLTLIDDRGARLRSPHCIVRGQAVDQDGDGREDLIFGCEDGFVYLSLNRGIRFGAALFGSPRRVQQRRPPLDCGVAAVPAACDLDGDGDTDLLVGNAAGEVCLIWNEGSDRKPAFARPRPVEVDGEVFRVVAGYAGSVQGPGEARWGYVALSAPDVDGDGDHDLLYSSVNGYHSCLVNAGTAKRPRWSRPTPVLSGGKHLRTVWRTRPVVTDWDGDGTLDYVCLDRRGEIGIFPGERGRPWNQLAGWSPWRFEDGATIDPDSENGMEGRAKIAVVDWDGDGRRDLLVGAKGGTPWTERQGRGSLSYLFFLGGVRGGREAVFARPRAIRRVDASDLEVGDHTVSPEIASFHGDRVPGLVLGVENGRLHYYRRRDLSW